MILPLGFKLQVSSVENEGKHISNYNGCYVYKTICQKIKKTKLVKNKLLILHKSDLHQQLFIWKRDKLPLFYETNEILPVWCFNCFDRQSTFQVFERLQIINRSIGFFSYCLFGSLENSNFTVNYNGY